ncbi:MAG: hypothetical protein H0W76_19515 [Pyrinomonadaceae bacterium]|nr:hypothetical protein [Pyrinomonadaceae bacterium]
MTDKGASTRPTLDTILERLNAFGEEMRKGFTAVGSRLDRVEELTSTMSGEIKDLARKIDELRVETQSGLRRVERQIGVLSKDVVEVRADLAEMDARLPKLEGQP